MEVMLDLFVMDSTDRHRAGQMNPLGEGLLESEVSLPKAKGAPFQPGFEAILLAFPGIHGDDAVEGVGAVEG